MNDNENPLKDTNEHKRKQYDTLLVDKETAESHESQSISALGLSKTQRIRIDELISLIKPHIKKEAEQPWSELCDILLEQRKRGKNKTHFYPGELVEKVKRTVGKRGERYGQLFYLFKVRIDGSDRRETDFWVFDDVLDDKERDGPIVERAAVGERYEFEAQRGNKTDFHLRALIKL